MENWDHTDNPHLDAGRVVVDDVEDIDEAEEDGDQQAHPPGHNLVEKVDLCCILYQDHLRGNNEWGPRNKNKQSRR